MICDCPDLWCVYICVFLTSLFRVFTFAPGPARPAPQRPAAAASVPGEGASTAGRGGHSPPPRWQPARLKSACCPPCPPRETARRQLSPKARGLNFSGGGTCRVPVGRRGGESRCRSPRGRQTFWRGSDRMAARWLTTFLRPKIKTPLAPVWALTNTRQLRVERVLFSKPSPQHFLLKKSKWTRWV